MLTFASSLPFFIWNTSYCFSLRMAPSAAKRALSPPVRPQRPRRRRRTLQTAPRLQVDVGSSSDEAPSEGSASDFTPPAACTSESDASGLSDAEQEPSPRPRAKPRQRSRSTATANASLPDVPPNLPSADAPSSFSASEAGAMQTALLDWYREHHRTFPWRLPPGQPPGAQVASSERAAGAPYSVLVSEIMSQQTRISVAARYFVRWMDAFPTVAALAAAPPERVRELWAGLGYYRRAANLHAAAQKVVSECGGKMPTDAAGLKKLPGVGAYTSGAVASICHGEHVPAVDGNVERVLARLRTGIAHMTVGVSAGKRAKAFDVAARQVMQDVESAGDFNQAMMELGATVCTPRAPRCGQCPLRDVCGARAEAITAGEPSEEYVVRYPIKDARKKVHVRAETVAVAVACAHVDGKWHFLLVQRPAGGLLGGMWEAPSTVLPSGTGPDGVKDVVFTEIARRVVQPAAGILVKEEADAVEAGAADCEFTGLSGQRGQHATRKEKHENKSIQIDGDAQPETGGLGPAEVPGEIENQGPVDAMPDADGKKVGCTEGEIEWRSAESVTHVFSHIRQTLVVRVAAVRYIPTASGTVDSVRYQWCPSGAVARKAVSAQMLKVFRSAGQALGMRFPARKAR